jgi:hypothetical protein
VDRFSHEKVNEVKVREPFQLKMFKKLLAFENLDDSKDTNRARKKYKREYQNHSSRQSMSEWTEAA